MSEKELIKNFIDYIIKAWKIEEDSKSNDNNYEMIECYNLAIETLYSLLFNDSNQELYDEIWSRVYTHIRKPTMTNDQLVDELYNIMRKDWKQ